MKNCIYFAGNSELSVTEPALVLGWGFDGAGQWRQGVPGTAAGVVVDDRWLPGPRAAERAAEVLRALGGTLVCDFERPVHPQLERLLRLLPPEDLVVPPAYAHLPHGAVLAGPYLPGLPFRRWLAAQRARYGEIVLDGAPLRCRVRPGCPPEPFAGPLPEIGCFNRGAGCLTARRDGACLFWDDRETLRRRCESAGVPVILLWQEWECLHSP